MTVMEQDNGQPEPRPDAVIYDLEETELPRPSLPGEVVVAATVDELIDHLAADLVIHAENCVRQFGDFHLALSGGATVEPLYRRLMYDPNYRWLPWRRTHLWFVEERGIPFEDERSNFRLISDLIGDHADIPSEQFHPIFAEAATAAGDYEAEIKEALGWREKGQDRLDYVLLTVGDDGRTAGLFPGSPAMGEAGKLVCESRDVERSEAHVTMTPLFINAARFIAVIATGIERAGTVQRLASGHETAEEMPIKGIAPMNGELKWYLDGPAVGRETTDDDV